MTGNIAALLWEEARIRPDQPAIIHHGRSISYAQLAENTGRRAAALLERGVRKGDRVLIFIPMSITLYEILLAVFQIGATAVFLDAWSDRRRMDQALTIADCKAFIGIWKSFFLMVLSKKMRQVPVKLSTAFSSSKPAPAISETHREDAALITFTTGSTGRPKAALRTHGFLMEQHRVLTEELQPEAGSIDLTTLPIFVLNNLASGVTSLIPSFDPRRPAEISPEKIAREARHFGVASSVGSPAFYDALAGAEIPSLKKMALGGASVFPDLAKKLMTAFPQAEIKIVYGSTEAEPISTISAQDLAATPDATIQKDGVPVGALCPYIRLAVIPLHAETKQGFTQEAWERFLVPAGNTGELCVSGSHVLKQYFNSPEAMRQNKIHVEGEIFHRTGDVGHLDASGTLFLKGRINTVFQRNEHTFCYPACVEYLLRKMPGIRTGTLLKHNGIIWIIIEPDPALNPPGDEWLKKEFAADAVLAMKKLPRDPRHQSKLDYDRIIAEIEKNNQKESSVSSRGLRPR